MTYSSISLFLMVRADTRPTRRVSPGGASGREQPLADSILLPIDSIVFRLGEMTVVRRHVLFLAALHIGFALL
jgi:hypothetical protein